MEAGPAYWQALNDHAFAYDSTVSEYWGGGGSPSASKRAWPYKLSSGFKTNCAWFGGLHCSGTYPKLVEVSLPLLQVRAPTGGAVAGGESLHASCARRWQLTAPRARLFPPRPPPYHGCCAVKEGLWWVVHWADGPQGCLQQLEVSVRGMGGGRAGLCAPLCRQWCSDARVRAARCQRLNLLWMHGADLARSQPNRSTGASALSLSPVIARRCPRKCSKRPAIALGRQLGIANPV